MHLTTSLRRSFGAAALVLLLVPLFAGCTSKTASAGETLRQASSNSSSADSVSFEMTIAMEGVGGQDLEVTAEGVYDLAKKRMQMTMGVLGMETRAVMDGSSMYLKMPLLGDDWYTTEAALPDAASNPLAAGFQDPTQVLAWLQASGNDVEDLGEEDIRSEKAKHFRTVLNLRDAANQLGGEHEAQIEDAINMLETDEMPVDLWINGDGLPVRLQYAMSFENSSESLLADAKMTFTMDYFDWGKPVRVDVPDATQAKDLKDAFGGLLNP